MKRITSLTTPWKIALSVSLVAAVAALATPPLGFLVNQVLAKGTVTDNINHQIQIARAESDPADKDWQIQLQVQGATDFYVQQLVLAPAGYSGWHSHPGVLVATVTAGEIDFYDENCQQRHVTAGQIFQENNKTHGIINNGSANAEITLAFLIKKDAPRRLEADPPACAAVTGIP